MKKITGEDCKALNTSAKSSSNEENGSDNIIKPHAEYIESEKEICHYFEEDEARQINYSACISMAKCVDFIRKSQSLKFPLELKMLKEFIHFEIIIGNVIKYNHAQYPQELQSYLENAYHYLSSVTDEHLKYMKT